MKNTKEIFKLIIQQLPDLNIFVLDVKGNYLLYSDKHKNTVKDFLDASIKEKSNVFDILQPQSFKEEVEYHLSLVLKGEKTTIYKKITHHNQLVYYNINLSPLVVDDVIQGVVGVISNITQERIQEKELQEAKQYMYLFSKLSHEGMFFAQFKEPVDWDNATNKDELFDQLLENEIVMYANDAMVRQLDATYEQIVGQNIKTLFDYPYQNVKRDYTKLLNEKEITLTTLERTNSGEPIWIEGHYVTIFNDDKKMIGHFGARRDITKKVQAQEALEHSHELMKYIIEHNRSAIAVFDKDMNYIYVSQKFRDTYDVHDPHIIGKNHYDMFPQLPERIRNVHQRALDGEVVISNDDTYLHASGKVEYTRWECRPWYNIDQKVGGMILYLEIITQQKIQEKIIQENQQLLKAMFSQAAIGIAYGPMNNEFNSVNQKLCEIMQYTEKELEKMSFDSLLYDVDNQKIKQKRHQWKSNGEHNFTEEVRLLRKDQSIVWANVTFSKIDTDSLVIPYSMIMIEDITERKEIEKEMYFLNYHDQLTGIYNRRFYEEELKRLDTKRNLPISLIVLDANGLKLINDAFGHLHGDEMIQEIAHVIKNECRADDIVARVGGDEFVVLLLKTNSDEAKDIVQRINTQLDGKTILNAPISVSAGVATKYTKEQRIKDVFSEAETKMYRKKLEFRSKTMLDTIQVILDAFFTQHENEKEHANRVSKMCYEMGKLMHFELNQLNKIKLAGLMHDIGKVNIPTAILNKVSELSTNEWDQIMKHSEVGYRILSAVNEFAEVSEVVLAHHERWDGKGYPKGLSKEDIPLSSRILAVVDAYDTMIHTQSYASAVSQEEALEELINKANKQFDPYLVELFIQNQVYDAVNES